MSDIQPHETITAQTPPPPDYPFSPSADEYVTRPENAGLQELPARLEALQAFLIQNPALPQPKAAFHEIARLAAGKTPHQGILVEALDAIDVRQEGADLILHAVLRLLYQFERHPALNIGLLARARQTVLNFKYWPDEPGIDSMCMWTESHYILFAAGGYLAGQLLPQEMFANSGQTGEQKMALTRERILRWLDLRFTTGFSEWLSSAPYDEDLTALLSLVDFCQDEEIRKRSTIVLDLLLLDMALHNFSGVFGSSHGRAYGHSKKWAAQENTSATQKLLFGRGVFNTDDNASVIAFSLSPNYQLPGVIYAIANQQEGAETVHRMRMGIPLEEAQWFGLAPKDFENGMHLLTLEAYLHPLTARLFLRMMDAFHWWENGLFATIAQHKTRLKTLRALGLLPFAMHRLEQDVCRGTREQVNLYTYRTPDYMLSCAQDYRKEFGGDQQHIWQATLGPNAVCFTTHPPRPSGAPPNYWSGSGCLPRAAQIKNVLIAIYRISKMPALLVHNELSYTHAWLPCDQFDELVEEDGWIFARLGDGYLALFSQHPYTWQEHPGENQHREVIVPGNQNTWVCEMGRKAVDGDFAAFRQRIVEAPLLFAADRVSYQSPSLGQIEFSWKGPLLLEGQGVPLADYPRYGGPTVQADFPSEIIAVKAGSRTLTLNWKDASRMTSDFI